MPYLHTAGILERKLLQAFPQRLSSHHLLSSRSLDTSQLTFRLDSAPGCAAQYEAPHDLSLAVGMKCAKKQSTYSVALLEDFSPSPRARQSCDRRRRRYVRIGIGIGIGIGVGVESGPLR